MRDTLRGCMFPIPSNRKLSVAEIAEYWSREITPPASAQELRDVISKAWWGGELIARNGASRLSILRGYYSRSANFVAFAIPDIEEPPQWESVSEGIIEFVRPLRVPLPNANPETWTEANCAPAFDAISEQWKEAIISPSVPIFLDIVLTSSEFFQWVDASGYKRPTFWSPPLEEQSEQEGLLDSTIPTIKITTVRPKRAESRAAWQAISALWPDGPAENLHTADIHRKVNKWIEKQSRAKYAFTEVSRDTVARLLRRRE
jgi:hypothetical protein